MKVFKDIKRELNKIIYLKTLKFKKQQINIHHAMLTGDDNFIDIRYSLTRPDLVPKNLDITLIDTNTGEKLKLMRFTKIGVVKTQQNRYRNNGILLFHNKNKILKAGANLSLKFGSYQSDIFNLNNQ